MLHVPGRDARWGKMVNKYAAIVYIRLKASMNKQKKKLLHPVCRKYLPVYITPDPYTTFLVR